MHHSGKVVNAMLKVPHITIGKLFFFFFFFIRAEGNICISQVTFASADDLQLEEIEFVHHTKCQRSKRD